MFFWTSDKFVGKENIICFEVNLSGKTSFRCSSNFPYEFWIDGKFVSRGGLRCVPDIAYLDEFDCFGGGKRGVVRVHYIHEKNNSVWHRMLFKDPFIYTTEDVCSCFMDPTIQFTGTKMSSQLDR